MEEKINTFEIIKIKIINFLQLLYVILIFKFIFMVIIETPS